MLGEDSRMEYESWSGGHMCYLSGQLVDTKQTRAKQELIFIHDEDPACRGTLKYLDGDDPEATLSLKIIFTDHDTTVGPVQQVMALRAFSRAMINCLVRSFVQLAEIALVTGLAPARFGLLAARLLVQRGRFGRSAGRLGRPLQFQHQFNQFALAQLVKLIEIHRHIDSEETSE